jgi:hypothetical protein
VIEAPDSGGRMSSTMTVGWVELRRAAVSATRRGWPVAPGTFLGSDRHWHGRDEAKALCPVEDTWRSAPVTDPDRAPRAQRGEADVDRVLLMRARVTVQEMEVGPPEPLCRGWLQTTACCVG